MSKRLRVFTNFMAVILITTGILIYQIGHSPVHAQAQLWNSPRNLSNSKAASQPSIISSPDGKFQVFWMDRFDGLVATIYDGAAWSPPQAVPLRPNQPIKPFIVADNSGWVHAFWTETSIQNSLYTPLYHSQMLAGELVWSQPALIAEDALTFEVVPDISGGLNLSYVRRANSQISPAGIYFRKKNPAGGDWGAAQNVFGSIYYRLLKQGDTTIALSDDGSGNIFLSWRDPTANQLLIADSNDNGVTWTSAIQFGDPQLQPTNPRLTAISGTTLGIWQSLSGGTCELYQQSILPSPGSLSGPTESISPTLTTSSQWSNAAPIFPDLSTCPQGDRFVQQPDKNQIDWIWGEGTNVLTFTTWDNFKSQWSSPIPQNFNFEESGTGRLILLGDLHTTLSGDQIAVVGADNDADIWFTQSNFNSLQMTYTSPPPWQQGELVTQINQEKADLALASDSTGQAHLIWVQPSEAGDLGASLYYSSKQNNSDDANQLKSNTTQLSFGAPDELVRQPSLLADEQHSLLHLVWSGGQDSEILYSRAPIDRANIPGEWFPDQVISSSPYATSPQIVSDYNNNLFVVYAVPVNEERGIYLVKSEDQGQSWSSVSQIYDAADSVTPAVDHPTLITDPDGTLYSAWVLTDRVGSGVPAGIYFSLSKDSGQSWSKPVVIAGPGNDFPRLALSSDQIHILYSQLTSSGGSIWHRTLPKAELSLTEENPWSPAIQISGTGEVSPSFGIATDEDTLHLVAASTTNGSVIYTTWQDGTWSKPEVANITGVNHQAEGIQAATGPNGGILSVAMLVNNNTSKQLRLDLYLSSRTIPTVVVKPRATPTPTPVQVATVEPTPTVVKPTPTPDLNRVPPPGASSQTPLIIAGGISLLVIGGLLGWRLIASRR